MKLHDVVASVAVMAALAGCPPSEDAARELKPVSTANAQVAPGGSIPPPGPLPNQNAPDRPLVKPEPVAPVPTPVPSTTGPVVPGTQPPPTVPGVAPVPVVPGPAPLQPAPAQSPASPAAGPAPPPPGTTSPSAPGAPPR